MSQKDLITLVISAVALIVAIYGVLERGLATRRALRIRLTEIIDSLAQIDTDEQVYAQDASKSAEMKTALRSANATRRALLAAQAVDTLARYGRRITIPEYVVLASALRGTSDTSGERKVLSEAVADLRKENAFQQSAAWRTWAWFNFEQGDVETGRRSIRRSFATLSPIDDFQKLERFDSLLSWFEFERQSGTLGKAKLSALLEEAETVLQTVRSDASRVDAGDRVQVARKLLATTHPAGTLGGSNS
jgi:hypothetical protein